MDKETKQKVYMYILENPGIEDEEIRKIFNLDNIDLSVMLHDLQEEGRIREVLL